jgi:hypothetical protein
MNPIKYYMYVIWYLLTGRFTSDIEVLQPEMVLHGTYLFLNWEYFIKNEMEVQYPFFVMVTAHEDCDCDEH